MFVVRLLQRASLLAWFSRLQKLLCSFLLLWSLHRRDLSCFVRFCRISRSDESTCGAQGKDTYLARPLSDDNLYVALSSEFLEPLDKSLYILDGHSNVGFAGFCSLRSSSQKVIPNNERCYNVE